MVFSDEDKAVIKNDFMEKNWSVYRICKEHPTKNWNQVSVRRLLKRFQCYGTMDRRSGSGRPRTVTTEENEMIVEELICSQEENPGTHLSPREIEKETGISRSSIQRMVKRSGYKQFKRLKTPRMNENAKKRRKERAGNLVERFDKNGRSIEKCVWQDEKDFTLEVPFNSQNNRVYVNGNKTDVDDLRLFHQTNKQAKKVMVSACITWKGVTKPFFVNNKGMKVNSKSYKKHLEKELIPEIEKKMNRNDWIFIQDSAPSQRANLVQGFLKEKLRKRFIKHNEWPPHSPDCNPLDYYFWDKIKTKVYEDRFNQAFENENELKKKIRKVWPAVSNDLFEIRKALKQFIPRLAAVEEKNGESIKMIFG